MPQFKIVNNLSEINLDPAWVPAAKFSSKDRTVDSKGKKVGTDFVGRKYRIIEKRELPFTPLERIGRGLTFVAFMVFSLGLALFSKKYSLDLLTKSKKTIRYAVLDNDTAFKQENGKIVYLNPKWLSYTVELPDSQTLQLALIQSSGKQKAVAVHPVEKSASYEVYSGSLFEAIYLLAKKNSVPSILYTESPLRLFLKHPDCLSNESEFVNFLLELDGSGESRLCALNQLSLLDALKLINRHNIALDSTTAQALFRRHAGHGNTELTRLLLEIHPSAIEATQNQKDSAFFNAALKGTKEEAKLLLQAIESRNLALSFQDLWVKRALTNDTSFSEEAFKALDQELKIKIFYTANAFAHLDLVEKLKKLGMIEAPLFFSGLDILAYNMDIIDAGKAMTDFLKELRQNGQLLTHQEFFGKDRKVAYLDKSDQIGRIQGTRFIKKIAEENGIKHVKVPKKIAVIQQGLEAVSFRIQNLELIPSLGHLTIYAERIDRVERKLSLEEAIEFMIVLEKTGYSDFYGDNFIIAKDGIYFIDTEYKDFCPSNPKFGSIESIKMLLDPKDVDAFLLEFQKRKERWEASQEIRKNEEAKLKKYFKNEYKTLALGYADHVFTFSLAALMRHKTTTP